ncbi:intracellular multiplication protein IcmL [Serratia fonticola]|uniref:Intracellular multiplication protein IcmL n=1 Tax=Serratia fonticola TaxID=47917 RepID=A0A542CRY5_SERFO|nr:DotI/IcmL family type IV secretion protein [Serratia fonticola]TQI77289.1 intracellular multiplication protein IcmL [Serratia fonticola]TQI93585.1 intracellular multiplication protein IcmL [Serratia fonticola]TVZ61614.1 intracellular multiplication protein IcmL [Serratia fonticola]
MSKQNAASAEESSPDTDRKIHEFDEKHLVPFMEAMQLHKDRMLNATFARKCLAVALVSVSFNLVQFPVNAWLVWQVAHPPVKYFATLNGSVLAQHPTSEPAYTDDDVIAFGDKVVRSAFQLDFKNFRTQISDQQQKFSEDGFRSYYSALTNSNLFSKVKTDKLLMSANVTRKGMIYRRGRESQNGPYIWEVQYPVTLSLDGQTRSLKPQNFIFTLRIQRTDVRLKPEGIEVASVVTRDAR